MTYTTTDTTLFRIARSREAEYIFFQLAVNIKQLLDEVFVISQKPNLIIVLLYIVLKKITTNALSQRSQFIFKHLEMYN